MSTHTFSTDDNPALFLEQDDGTGKPERLAANSQVLVRNADDGTPLDSTESLDLGYLSFTTTDVPGVQVSGDNGATWKGPFWSKEARESAVKRQVDLLSSSGVLVAGIVNPVVDTHLGGDATGLVTDVAGIKPDNGKRAVGKGEVGPIADEGQPTDGSPTLLMQCVDAIGQDITTDGTYWYWGHDNGAGKDGTIRKIDPSTGATLSTFTSPPHSSSCDYSSQRGTLFVSSGAGETPVVWEIDPDGTKLRSWDFTSTGTVGCLVAVDDTATDNTVWLCTRDGNHGYELDVRRVTLNDDGTWTNPGGVLLHTANNGVAQGMCGRNGRLYLITDDPNLPARRVSRFSLVGSSVVIQDRTWVFETPNEAEGVMFWQGSLHYGDSFGKVYTAPYQPLNTQTVARKVIATESVSLGMGSAAPLILAGDANPYGSQDAPPGSLYTDSNGMLFVQTAAGVNGWKKVTLGSAAPTTYVSDSFNRADSASSLGTADSGQAWVVPAVGSNQPVAGISSNQAYFPTPAGGGFAWIDSTVSDCIIELTYSVIPVLGCGIMFRAQDEKNGYVGNGSAIYRMVNGVISSSSTWALGFYSDYHTLNDGDRVRVILTGDTIAAFVRPVGETNWIAAQPIAGTSSSDGVSMFSAATNHGFRATSSTARFDDFTVTELS